MCEINWPDSVPHLVEASIPEGLTAEKRTELEEQEGYKFSNIMNLALETFEDVQARAIVIGLLESRWVYEAALCEAQEQKLQNFRSMFYGPPNYAAHWNYIMNILGYTEVYDV